MSCTRIYDKYNCNVIIYLKPQKTTREPELASTKNYHLWPKARLTLMNEIKIQHKIFMDEINLKKTYDINDLTTY